MEESQGAGAYRVFFSYCHEDDRYRDKIDKHLSLLKRQGLIASWYDHKITAGKNLDEEIARELEQADIILLLASSSFIASDYCYCKELKRAIDRHEAGQARVVPIIVRDCEWHSSVFAKLKALPRDGEAVTSWKNRDEAYKNIAMGIREVVKELNAGRPSAASGTKEASAAGAGDEEKPSLLAQLSISAEADMLRRIGCPYLTLKLVCTSKRPAKIKGVTLRIKGSQHLKAFQHGFGSDFGHTPVAGNLAEEGSLGFYFVHSSWPQKASEFTIERDEACTFFLPGLWFDTPLFAAGAPADVWIAVKFLDGRTETVLRGETIQHSISGLQETCRKGRYRLNPMLPVAMNLEGFSQTPPDLSAVGRRNKRPVILLPDDVVDHSAQGGGMEVFDDFPELTAIGQDALQKHCDDWLKTSIARQSRINILAIGEKGSKVVIADVGIETPYDIQPGEHLHFPLDHLLYYLIEHIAPAEQHDRMRALVAEKRFHGGPMVFQRFKVAPPQPLAVICKNPGCGEVLRTQLVGYDGRPPIRNIEPVACPRCGVSSTFVAEDFFVFPFGGSQSSELQGGEAESK
jgi:hypothetical protein